MKTSLLILILTAALAVPAWADFKSDLAAARGLDAAQKYTEAVTAFQTAIASATSVADKESTTLLMAIATKRSGNMEGGLKILTDLASTTTNPQVRWAAQNNWVVFASTFKSVSEIEAVALPLLAIEEASPWTYDCRTALVRCYAQNKAWSKIPARVKDLAAHSGAAGNSLAGVLEIVTKNALSIFGSKEEQVAFYADLLRIIPAIEANSAVLGQIKSQLELLK